MANVITPELLKLPALSIRQPWAWMILHAGKDIENRSWKTSFRGRFLIHAAKGCAAAEYDNAIVFALRAGAKPENLPDYTTMKRGGIVGVAEIVDCLRFRQFSPWFVGPFGFVIRNVQPLEFYPCRGALGFFNVEGCVS